MIAEITTGGTVQKSLTGTNGGIVMQLILECNRTLLTCFSKGKKIVKYNNLFS